MHVLVIPSERYVTPLEHTAGIFQRDQARALYRAGIKIGVIAPAPASIRLWRFWGMLDHLVYHNDGFPVYRASAKSLLPGRLPYFIAWLFCKEGERLFKEYCNQHGWPDLIHAHNALYAGVLASRLKQRFGLPYILTEHSSAYQQGKIYRWQRKLVRKALGDSNYCLMVSRALGLTVEKMFPNCMQKWDILPNVLDPLFEHSSIVRCSGASTDFVFLSVGHLVKIKNYQGLLKAFAEAFRDDKRVRLRIGGTGPLRKDLERLAEELHINDQVDFLGRLERREVLREMQNCDVFVLPSLYETFGVVIIEALACGRPVIATASGGPTEIVNEKNGVLVPPGDVKALRDALLIMKKEVRRFDCREIREDCIAKYGEKAIVDQLIAAYNEILEVNNDA